MKSQSVRILLVGTRADPCPCCGRECACATAFAELVSDPGPTVAELKRFSDELIEAFREPPPEEFPDPVPPRLRGQPHRGRTRKAQREVEHSSRRGLRMHRRRGR